MRPLLLIFVSLLLPLIWGWGMHRLLSWLWPAQPPGSAERGAETRGPDARIDYQI